MNIRPLHKQDIKEIVRLSLLAWSPVFISFEDILGWEIFKLIWPDWMTSQKEDIEATCLDETKSTVIVAEMARRVVGFLAYTLNWDDHTGEVIYLAVHPQYQNQGIGTALNKFALVEMKEKGMKLAVVSTGGDPAHAPARRSYEKAGYSPLPLVRYYKDL
jgi:ribosomal protein S18 acetylase RimI-like enzyme